MRVTSPTGRDYEVSRRWRPWPRLRLDSPLLNALVATAELVLPVVLLPIVVLLRVLRVLPWEVVVREVDAQPEAAVLRTTRVRGWSASAEDMQRLAREIESRQA